MSLANKLLEESEKTRQLVRRIDADTASLLIDVLVREAAAKSNLKKPEDQPQTQGRRNTIGSNERNPLGTEPGPAKLV